MKGTASIIWVLIPIVGYTNMAKFGVDETTVTRDSFNTIFADKHGGILLGHIFEPCCGTVITGKAQNIFDALNGQG